MNSVRLFRGMSILPKTGCRKPLLGGINTQEQDGCDQVCNVYDKPSAQNTFNAHEEQRLQSEEEFTVEGLAELLGVASGDGSHCANWPETKSGQQNPKERLIQRYVCQYFPKPPADLDKNLQQHLLNVQDTMVKEIERLGPGLERLGLMGCLIDCYHRQTFYHLNDLLQNIYSSQNSLVLIKWVLHTYLSPELLGHPGLQQMDPIKKVDLLLLTELVAKAKVKLIENVQKNVRTSLEKILQNERNHEGCDPEEVNVRLYVDTIQCIDAMPEEAQKISSKLSDDVRDVVFQELLKFLERYAAEQTEILEEKAKLDTPETIHFFKTLNTCKELKQHIQTKNKGVNKTLLQENVVTLETMEAFALKLLMEIVADIAESLLKKYFKSGNKEFFSLISEVNTHFPKLSWCQDVHKRVVDKIYKNIAQIYLKCLVRRSQRKLKKRWSANVGQTVAGDVKLLHESFSALAPGVQQWNLMLLKVTELLDCQSIEAMKLTVASMQTDCPTWSEDLDLLPTMLRWKGLSKRQVTEVLDALPGPGQQPRTRSESWYSSFTCW